MERARDWTVWLLLIAGVAACLAAAPARAQVTGRSSYRLDAPDQTLRLPGTLDEISGLSAAKDPDSLWAVDDERATLFRISTRDGSVLEELPLGMRGDFEAVEEIDGVIFVARSVGVLLMVDPRGGTPTALNFQIEIGLACDLEGLGYQPALNRLLLTCKNESSKTRREGKAFEIYAMALDTKTVQREPVYVLSEQAIDDYIAAHPEQPELKRSKGKRFAPSGLAVHPQTGEIYILSTRGKMVVVLAPTGELVQAWALDPAIHPQPEGMAFAAEGTLFISSEAHGKRALLHRFTPSADPKH